MNFSKKIDNICEFIFKNYGIYEGFPKKDKLIIHDNVFGTLEFTEYERKIINSPFLQRLTQISQMGLANTVYPGAVHNRFSHSLGVSYIAEKIYIQVMKGEKRSNAKRISDINTVKLAGLMHDIGHGPFSHVSDELLKRLSHYPSYKRKDIDAKIFARNTKSLKDVRNVHEFIAFHLLQSNSLKELISNVYSCIPLDQELIPYCITGNKEPSGNNYIPSKDLHKTLLIKIINGFSDADKIDYLLRDSKFSGLPLPADIDRLISFFKKIKPSNTSYELGVDEKGTRAFHLLLQSKAKMYPTVYQHHTTQSFETLLQFGIISAILNVDEATVGLDSEKWPIIEYGLDLQYYTDNSLIDYLRIIKDPISNDVVKRIYNRRHYRKLSRVYTWEILRQNLRSTIEFKKTNVELKALEKTGDIDKFEEKFKELYDKHTEEEEGKVSDFYRGFDTFDKIKKFKKDMISKDPDIMKKLKSLLPNVEEEILYNYGICIRIADELPVNPYTQPYITRYNQFKNEIELLSLSQMKFREPKILDYQQITFYSLPEISEKLEPIIKGFIKTKLLN